MPYFINLIFFLKTRKAAFKKADKIFLFVIFFACAKKMTQGTLPKLYWDMSATCILRLTAPILLGREF